MFLQILCCFSTSESYILYYIQFGSGLLLLLLLVFRRKMCTFNVDFSANIFVGRFFVSLFFVLWLAYLVSRRTPPRRWPSPYLIQFYFSLDLAFSFMSLFYVWFDVCWEEGERNVILTTILINILIFISAISLYQTMMYCTFMLPKSWKIVSLRNIFRHFLFLSYSMVFHIYNTYFPGIIVLFIFIAFVILRTTHTHTNSVHLRTIFAMFCLIAYSRTIDLVECAHITVIFSMFFGWIWNRINILSCYVFLRRKKI